MIDRHGIIDDGSVERPSGGFGNRRAIDAQPSTPPQTPLFRTFGNGYQRRAVDERGRRWASRDTRFVNLARVIVFLSIVATVAAVTMAINSLNNIHIGCVKNRDVNRFLRNQSVETCFRSELEAKLNTLIQFPSMRPSLNKGG